MSCSIPRIAFFSSLSLPLLLLFTGAPAAPAATLAPIVDLNPGSAGSFPSNITVFADTALFGAYTQATGTEPWRYDGTNIVLVRDINDTADDIGFGVLEGNDSFPAWFTEYNGKLYFSAFDPYRGGELWQYDGVAATRAFDISPDADDSEKFSPHSSWPQELTVFNGALFFSANGGVVSTNYELWKYEAGTASMVVDLHPPAGTNQSSFPNGFTVLNDALYFMADDGENGYELWKHDGANTVMVENIHPGGPESSSYPKYFTAFNGKIYFQAFHSEYGYEWWETDGTNATLTADLFPGPESSFPEFFTVYDNHLYFRATDPVQGSELWRFDGQTAAVVQDINPFGHAYPKNFTLFNGELLFAADDGAHGWELWRFDGATASLVADLNPWGDSFPESLVVLNGVLYFVATTLETGYEIYQYDGAGISLAADLNPGEGSSYPQFLTSYRDQLLFRAAQDGVLDWELWSLASAAPVSPLISSVELEQGAVMITVNGSMDFPHVLESSVDLENWTPLSTNTPSAGTVTFQDTESAPLRFYRVAIP